MTIQFPSEAQVDQHLAVTRRRLTTRIHRRRAGTRIAVGGGAVLLAGSGIAASIAVTHVSAEIASTTVTCYSHDDLGSFSSSAAMAQATTGDGASQPVEGVDKAEMCASMWRAGLKEAAASPDHRWPAGDPNTMTLPVPELAFCTLNDGLTGGFPIEAPSVTAQQVCDRLGLPYLANP